MLGSGGDWIGVDRSGARPRARAGPRCVRRNPCRARPSGRGQGSHRGGRADRAQRHARPRAPRGRDRFGRVVAVAGRRLRRGGPDLGAGAGLVGPHAGLPQSLESNAGRGRIERGSAVAVAAGAVAVALGTDTGGSIRIPAALCGVAGLRPTQGTVGMRGITPLAPSMDTVGPIALTVRECLRIHGLLGGAVEPAPGTLAGLRVGWPVSLWGDKIDPEVLRLVEESAETLRGADVHIVEIELPLARRH